MLKFKISLIICFISQTPVYLQECSNHSRGVKDLGSGYFYISTDPGNTDIIYTFGKDYQGTGLSVVPHRVDEVGFNEQYIIARQTARLTDSSVQYWIIDKNGVQIELSDCRKWSTKCDSLLTANVIGPLDSLKLIQELESRNIDIRLRN